MSADQQIPHRQSTVASHVTLSNGISDAISNPTETAADLIQKADSALYQAKNAGHNCIVCY